MLSTLTLRAAQVLDFNADILRPGITTLAIGVIAIGLLIGTMLLLDKILPYSVNKEIEEDQNIALAILMGSVVIGVSLVIAAVATGGA